MKTRPEAGEIEDPYRTSFDQVPEGHVLDIMARENVDTGRLLATIGEERSHYRYAPNKWSVKEVVGHLADSERIMSYRALSFARGEKRDLPGYEQDDYAATGRFDARPLADLMQEFAVIRASTIAMFRGFDDGMLRACGSASGCSFTVRALAYVICGHEIHHKKILRERYL